MFAVSYLILAMKVQCRTICIKLHPAGIGRAIAVRLAELGAKVIGISRTQADLESLVKQVLERIVLSPSLKQ